MLNEAQIQRVWEGLLGAEIRANYFADMVGVYKTRQQWATWTTLLLASGATGAAVASAPAWARVVLPLLTAFVSLYLATAHNATRSVDCADLHFRWARLADDYERLWEASYDKGALDRLNELTEKAAGVSKASTALPDKERRMLKWQRHVVMHRTARHALA